jgi:hypothetical protein
VRKAALLGLLLVAFLPLPPAAPFTAPLPDGMPRLEAWDRIAGDAVVGSPRLRVQYEFYVNPERPALYELIRYRVSRADGSATADHPGLEKVQWHAGFNDFRRYECGPAPERADACHWRHIRQGTDEFLREVPTILWLYGLHRQSLQASAAH